MKCCTCNASGSCANCVCAKHGKSCENCIPGIKNRCKNGGLRHGYGSISNSASQENTPSGELSNSQRAQQLIEGAAMGGADDVISSAPPSPSQCLSPRFGSSPLLFSEQTSEASDCHSSTPPDELSQEAENINVNAAYEMVVCWKPNLFIVPFGAAGSSFVDELASIIRGFVHDSSSRSTAWKAVLAC